MILEHVIKGFLKEAGKYTEEIKLAAYKSKIDGLVFVAPRRIPIMRDGVILEEEDGIDERILRAETAKGPRTALVGSEMVDTPWEMVVEITLLANSGTAKSEPITFDTIQTALDYGSMRGLGQFRNGGYGRFAWEAIARNRFLHRPASK